MMFEKTIATLIHHQALLKQEPQFDVEIIDLTFNACYEELQRGKIRIHELEAKEIGVKPIKNKYGDKICNICGCRVTDESGDDEYNYCSNCGQSIDWGE